MAEDKVGVPIQMVENFVLKNSRITASKPEQKLFERLQNGGSLELYHLALREEYTGQNNRFFNSATKEVFDLSPTWSPQVWSDFATWQKIHRAGRKLEVGCRQVIVITSAIAKAKVWLTLATLLFCLCSGTDSVVLNFG
jgi:hypothetical protein